MSISALHFHTFRFVARLSGLLVGWFCIANCEVSMADWPGILGPTRNGYADSSCVVPETLKELKLLWTFDAGQGYAGPAVAGNEVVTFERVGDNDRVRCLNATTGKEIWKRDLPAKYRGGYDSDKGPRCVPAILETSILVYGAAGYLSLLARKDGAVLWSRSLGEEYQGSEGYFGVGSTPLVIDGKAIVNVGGKSASVVCVSLADGKTAWTDFQGEASYASPILIQGPNKSSIAVVPTRLTLLGLDVGNGNELWKVPFGKRGPTVNAAMPILLDSGDLYLTASYDIGAVVVRPGDSTAAVVRKGTEMSSQYATPIAVGENIFGSDGREDVGGATYKCVRAEDGKILWEEQSIPICHTIGDKSRLLLVGIDGRLWGLAQDSTSFRALWKSRMPDGVFRALPAFSDNKLYVRSSGGKSNAWYCFELR